MTKRVNTATGEGITPEIREKINELPTLREHLAKRDRTEQAADDEPRVSFVLPGNAAAQLQIDEREIWPNIKHGESRKIGRSGWAYLISLPVIDAEKMLDDCIGYGNQSSGGEGFDIEPSAKYACRKAAARIAKALQKPAPKWSR